MSIGTELEQLETHESEREDSVWAYRFVWGIGVALLGLVMTALFTGANAADGLPTMTKPEQSSAFIYVSLVFVAMAVLMGGMWSMFSEEQKRSAGPSQ